MRIGFDRDKYLRMQSSHIAERRAQFSGKLYLEFGGKLIDDMHASRVLPGFTPDNKIVMLAELADEVEIVMAVNAKDLARNKVARTWASPTRTTCCVTSMPSAAMGSTWAASS